MHQDFITEVIIGWCHSVQSYFMVIEKPEIYIDHPFWIGLTNINHFSVFLAALKELGIQLPPQMIQEVIADKFYPAPEKKVYHSKQDNQYIRHEIPLAPSGYLKEKRISAQK